MTDRCIHSPLAHSKIICWWLPGGYDLSMDAWYAASARSTSCQSIVVYSSAPWNSDVSTCWPRPVRSRA